MDPRWMAFPVKSYGKTGAPRRCEAYRRGRRFAKGLTENYGARLGPRLVHHPSSHAHSGVNIWAFPLHCRAVLRVPSMRIFAIRLVVLLCGQKPFPGLLLLDLNAVRPARNRR